MLAGVYLVALERLGEAARPPMRDTVYGLCTALCWAASPVMIKHGLRGLPSPLLGVTVGMICALAVYAAALAFTGRKLRLAARGSAMAVQLLAGLFVGLSVWSRWTALDSASVGVVLALSLLAVPVVVSLSPIVVGRHLERITPRILLGSALVVVGALALVVES